MSVAACRPKQKRARHTPGNVGMDFSGLNSRHLRQGKHRFATFQQVAASDRMYCAWVIHAPPRSLPPSLVMFKQYLLAKHGGVVRVGKFKSLFFDELYEREPAYCVWVAGLADPGVNFLELQGFLTSAAASEAAPCPPPSVSSDYYYSSDEEFHPATPHRRVEQRTGGVPGCSPSKRSRVTQVEPCDGEALQVPKCCLVCCERPVKTIFAGCGQHKL